MKQLSSGADQPKKRTTLTTQQTLVGSQTAPKPALSRQKTLVQQPKPAQKQVSAQKSAQKQVSATKSTQKPMPASATANGATQESLHQRSVQTTDRQAG